MLISNFLFLKKYHVPLTRTFDEKSVPLTCILADCRTTFAEQACPAGSYIKKISIAGDVECEDPNAGSPATDRTCPAGEIMKGIRANGVLICTPKAPDCRLVTDSGTAPLYYSKAQCDIDEYLAGGGGECPAGFMHNNRPKNLTLWVTDCFNGKFDPLVGSDTASTAYAICCKKN